MDYKAVGGGIMKWESPFQTQVQMEDPSKAKISITVAPEKVSEALARATRNVQKKVRVPGFRVGHVPEFFIKTQFKGDVIRQATENLLQEAYWGALEQNPQVEPVGQPEFEFDWPQEGQPFHVTIHVETWPAVNIVNLEGLPAQSYRVQMDDLLAEKAAWRSFLRLCPRQKVEAPSGVQDADKVLVSIKGRLLDRDADDPLNPRLNNPEVSFIVGLGQVLDEIESGIKGLELGQMRSIQVTFPQDYADADLRGLKAELEVKVQEILRPQWSEMNDESTQAIFGKSRDEFIRMVREDWLQRAQKDADRLLKNSLLESLVRSNPVPVPEALRQQAREQVLKEEKQYWKTLGLDPEAHPDLWDFQKNPALESRAQFQAQLWVIWHALSKQERWSLTPEELEHEFQNLAQQTGVDVNKVKKAILENPQRKSSWFSQWQEKKILNYLSQKAQIQWLEYPWDAVI